MNNKNLAVSKRLGTFVHIYLGNNMTLRQQKRHCLMCKSILRGRPDKRFCSIICKSSYHRKLRQATTQATRIIDAILHRNRSILLEILGKRKTQIKVDRLSLDQKKFNFHYFTGRTINKQGKAYHHIYDFRYMQFSDNDILIIRKKS